MIPQDWKRELAWPDLTEIWTCRSHLNGAQSKRERERKKNPLIISPTLRNKLILHQIVWCNTRSCVVFNYKMSSKRKRTASYQIFISQLSWKNIFWWRRYRLKFISHIYLMFPLRERERERDVYILPKYSSELEGDCFGVQHVLLSKTLITQSYWTICRPPQYLPLLPSDIARAMLGTFWTEKRI